MVGKRTKKSEKPESASNEQKNLGKKRSKVSPKAEEGDELETKKLHVDEVAELSDADDGNNPTDEDAISVEKQDVEEKHQEKSHSAPRKRGKAAVKDTESSNNGVEAEKVNDASEKSENEDQGENADDNAGSKKRGRAKGVKSKEKVAPQKRGRLPKSAPVNTDEEDLEDEEAAKVEDDGQTDSGSEKKSKLAKDEKESKKQNDKLAKLEDEEPVEKKRGRGAKKVTKNEEKKEVETRVQRKGRNQKTVPKYAEKSGSEEEEEDDDFHPKKKSRATSEEDNDFQPKKSGRAAKSVTKSKKRGAGASSYKDMCEKEVRIVLEHCKS